jgi:CPA1 family monovalent cation:H+ antiporter
VHSFLPLAITALFILAFVQVVAPRIRVPSPVLLAILGMLVSFLPFAHDFRIDPAVVLVGFLPPLLYADAFKTSWVDFKRWLRPILMLAVLLVAITILAVGVVAPSCRRPTPSLSPP